MEYKTRHHAQKKGEASTTRTDGLYDLYDLFPLLYSTTVHDLDLPGRADRYIPDLYNLYDLYDLYDLAHVSGWEPQKLHDLGHVSWVGSVLYRSCTTYHNGRLGSSR